MSYLAEQSIWWKEEMCTTSYGFFLSYKDWDMIIVPFVNKKDRDEALDVPKAWGLSDKDYYDVAALISAYAESYDDVYQQEAFDIANEYDGFSLHLFETYVNDVLDMVDNQ
jgi:hypothetical protein